MKNSKQLFTTLLLTGVALLLTACGAEQVANTDLSSRTPVATVGDATTKHLAYCNKGAGNDIAAKLKTYQESTTNNIRMDLVVLRLTSLPSTFTSDSSYFTMWKWLANNSGYTYLDQTSLSFILIDSVTGQAVTNWRTTLRWSDVSTAASKLEITDPQTFFNRMNIIVDLKDVAGEYDVLKISNYSVSTNKAIGQMDALLPLFAANPADYSVEPTGGARASVLQALHPFKDLVGQNWSSSQYQSMSNNFCF